MDYYRYKIVNLSSGQVILPAPVNTTIYPGKYVTYKTLDANSVLRNQTYILYQKRGLIQITEIDGNYNPPPPSPQPPNTVIIVGPEGPPGPPGPPGPSGGAGDSGTYSCAAGVNIGVLVRASADDTVSLASASSMDTMPVLGVVTSKPTATTCIVQYRGEAAVFSGLISGKVYFASTVPGNVTHTAPSGDRQVIQRVGVAKDSNTLVVDIDEYIEL